MVRCRSAVAACSTSSPSSVPRCSSTTRRTFGRDAAKRSPRSGPAAPCTRRRRSCARRWPASPTTRACCSMSPAVARCTSRSLPACLRTPSRSTATTRASTSSARRSPAACRHIVVDSFDELDRLDALARRGTAGAGGPCSHHAWRARAHPRVHRHGAGRLQVRVQPRQRRCATRGRPHATIRQRRTGRRALPHRLQRVRRVQLREGGGGDGRLRRAARSARVGARWRPRRRLRRG